ncbi:MAG: hypothetical protein JWR48_3023 [Mycobacterium sp.]|jgi:hypothetical protein|nr:hypothetical protein [Mycobacterium sp.]
MTAYDVAAWTLAYPEFPRNRGGPACDWSAPRISADYRGSAIRLATTTISGGSANSTDSIAT